MQHVLVNPDQLTALPSESLLDIEIEEFMSSIFVRYESLFGPNELDMTLKSLSSHLSGEGNALMKIKAFINGGLNVDQSNKMQQQKIKNDSEIDLMLFALGTINMLYVIYFFTPYLDFNELDDMTLRESVEGLRK